MGILGNFTLGFVIALTVITTIITLIFLTFFGFPL